MADGRFGNQVGRKYADLASVIKNQDGAASYFAAGAGRGWNGNDGCGGRGDSAGSAFDKRKAFKRAGVGCADGRALGQVYGRSAAYRDDAVVPAVAVHNGGGAHGLDRKSTRLNSSH